MTAPVYYTIADMLIRAKANSTDVMQRTHLLSAARQKLLQRQTLPGRAEGSLPAGLARSVSNTT